jgi:hypothetical protein
MVGLLNGASWYAVVESLGARRTTVRRSIREQYAISSFTVLVRVLDKLGIPDSERTGLLALPYSSAKAST